jgi:peptide/nickel transport system ATP-binding protein
MLVLEGVSKTYGTGWFRSSAPVFHGVDLRVNKGDTFGLFGSSGSGKSTLARMIPGLISPSAGKILFKGKDVVSSRGNQRRVIRQKVQLIFQNPRLSLDPKQTVFDAVAEPMKVHGLATSRAMLGDKVMALLADCGLPDEIACRRPREISGGQAQRVVLARALGIGPELIIGDEMTAMLDVSVQAQILKLLQQLQKERGLTIILISHDMDLLKAVCNRAAVLEEGILRECPATWKSANHERIRAK